MNNRTKALLERAKKAQSSSNETLKRTTPKATLGGIKQAAEQKFDKRKSKKQIQPKKPKAKKQPKPKAVSSDKLDQWKQAMEKSGIPKHRWKKLEDKISRITGPKRKEIEDSLFEHDMFKAVYSVGEDDPELTDEYLSDLEEKVNEVMDEINNLTDMVDDINEFIQENPELGAVVITYVIGGNTMNFKATKVEDGYVFEDEQGTLIAGFDSTKLDDTDKGLLEDAYKVMNNENLMDQSNLKPFKPMSPDEFKKALEEFNKNNKKD